MTSIPSEYATGSDPGGDGVSGGDAATDSSRPASTDDSASEYVTIAGFEIVEKSFGPIRATETASAGLLQQWRALRGGLVRLGSGHDGVRTRAGTWLAVTLLVGPMLLIGVAEALGAVEDADRLTALTGVGATLLLWLVLANNSVRLGEMAAGRKRFEIRTDTGPVRLFLAVMADFVAVMSVCGAMVTTGHGLLAPGLGFAAMGAAALGSVTANRLVNGDSGNLAITGLHMFLLCCAAYATTDDGGNGTARVTLIAAVATGLFGWLFSTRLARVFASVAVRLRPWRLRALVVWIALPYGLTAGMFAMDGRGPRWDRVSVALLSAAAVLAAARAAWWHWPARVRRRRAGGLPGPADEVQESRKPRSELWNQSGWLLILSALSFGLTGLRYTLSPIDLINPPDPDRVISMPVLEPTTEIVSIPMIDSGGRPTTPMTISVPRTVVTGWRSVTLRGTTQRADTGQKIVGGLGLAGGVVLGVYGGITLYLGRNRPRRQRVARNSQTTDQSTLDTNARTQVQGGERLRPAAPRSGETPIADPSEQR